MSKRSMNNFKQFVHVFRTWGAIPISDRNSAPRHQQFKGSIGHHQMPAPTKCPIWNSPPPMSKFLLLNQFDRYEAVIAQGRRLEFAISDDTNYEANS